MARVTGGNGDPAGWHSAFQLCGELTDAEWRIVALAGSIAERIDAGEACDTQSLLDALECAGVLSASDASLARGYSAVDVERCVELVTRSWRMIETEAAERATEIEENHALLWPRRACIRNRL